MKIATTLLPIIQIIFFSLSAMGQDGYSYAVSGIPAEMKENVNVVKRMEVSEFDIIAKDEAVYKYKVAYTFLNKNTMDLEELTISYDNNLTKLTSVKACMYDANGTEIKCFKKRDFEDYAAYSEVSFIIDDRVRYLDMGHYEYPYTIEYSYTINHNGLLFFPAWVPIPTTKMAVESSTFILKKPDNIQILTKQNLLDIEPIISFEDKEVSTWKTQFLHPLEVEEVGPFMEDQIPLMFLMPKNFSISGYDGTNDSWQSIGAFFSSLKSEPDMVALASTMAILKERTDSLENTEDIIAEVYRYVQENTRYVSVQLGIGGWQPFPVDYVVDNQYGDCKALTNFTQTLLELMDIPSYYTLINAGSSPRKIDPDFSLPVFNHVFLMIPLESDTMYLECTSSNNPPNFLGTFTDNRYALVVTPEDSKLIKTPAYTPQNNCQSSFTKLTLLPDGNADAHTVFNSLGAKQSALRDLYHYLDGSELEKAINSFFGLRSFEIKKHSFAFDDDWKQSMASLSVDLNIRKFGVKAGNRLLISPMIADLSIKVPEAVEDRQFAVVNRRAYALTDTVEVSLPDGFIIENYEEEAISIDSPFGRFYSEIIPLENKSFQYIRHFELDEFELPANTYEDYRSFLINVNKGIKTQVVLLKE